MIRRRARVPEAKLAPLSRNEYTAWPLKVSRGEENIFIWCFFLAIVQLTLDGAEAYEWVKYIYVDDPISSLDENNAENNADAG